MTPALYASYANRLFSYRWLFLAASLIGIALVIALVSIPAKPLVAVAGIVVGPAIAVPWGLLCMCVWFHPQRGRLLFNSKFTNWLPSSLKVFIRWYSALFLSVFFIVGAVVFPVLALTWLSNA